MSDETPRDLNDLCRSIGERIDLGIKMGGPSNIKFMVFIWDENDRAFISNAPRELTLTMLDRLRAKLDEQS